jgi:hypothetical protein
MEIRLDQILSGNVSMKDEIKEQVKNFKTSVSFASTLIE